MIDLVASHLDALTALAPVWGFPLVFLFMAVESSFIPFPSEVVMLPAGFLAFRGELTLHSPWPDAALALLFGTEKGGATEEKAVAMLESGEVFDFRPGRLVAALGLLAPSGWTYRDTASGGHFGRAAFPWERTDRADAVRDALGLR